MEITVTGQAQESFAPERALARLELAFEAAGQAEAVQQVTELAGEFTAAVDELLARTPSPASKKEVQPLSTSSWRPYDADGNPQPLRYRASVGARVTFADFDELSRFLDAWGRRDGVAVNGVDWSLTDQRLAAERSRILAAAVVAARERAQVMADAAGTGAIKFEGLADDGSLVGRPPYGSMPRMAMAAGDEGIDLTPADIVVSATVQARFSAS